VVASALLGVPHHAGGGGGGGISRRGERDRREGGRMRPRWVAIFLSVWMENLVGDGRFTFVSS
jgi:hypothetical protein